MTKMMQTNEKRQTAVRIRLTALLVSLLLSVMGAALPLQASAQSLYDLPAGTTISASSVVLVSLGATPEDDRVLYELKPDTKRTPAAVVRLMVGATAIKLIRDKGLDIDKTTGTYTKDVFKIIAGAGLPTVNMAYGEVWTVRDLLSISMIQTAADAVATLAVTLGGSDAAFVAEMNKLAKEMGCENSYFSNVTGIDTITQYTTARDLYRIMRFAMDYPEFEPLFAATEYTCHPVSGGSARTYANTNDMLRSTKANYYSPMAFGKTGFTSFAGRCLASVARDSGYEYLCVVLGSAEKDQNGGAAAHYIDTRTLYKWAFNNFTYKPLLNKNEPLGSVPVDLCWDKDVIGLIPQSAFSATVANTFDADTLIKKVVLDKPRLTAPVKRGQVCGKVELYINVDQKIGEVTLVAAESADRSELLALWSQVQGFFSSPWFFVGLALLALLIAAYAILFILHNRRRRQKGAKRVTRYR